MGFLDSVTLPIRDLQATTLKDDDRQDQAQSQAQNLLNPEKASRSLTLNSDPTDN